MLAPVPSIARDPKLPFWGLFASYFRTVGPPPQLMALLSTAHGESPAADAGEVIAADALALTEVEVRPRTRLKPQENGDFSFTLIVSLVTCVVDTVIASM